MRHPSSGGDLAGIAATLDDIGRVRLLQGQPEASLECHRASYQVRDQLGDARSFSLDSPKSRTPRIEALRAAK